MQRDKLLELPDVLRPGDVAAYLQCSKKFAYRLAKTPGSPFKLLSSKWYYVSREAFLRWLEEQPGTAQLSAARAIEDARRHPVEAPHAWEKAGNGTTPRAVIRMSRRD